MNLRHVSDQDLISKTRLLVESERELLAEILHHLAEIDRRRLYCDLGFKSLHDYAMKSLGYSEDQAVRRINAARLIKDIPEVEEKIARGDISLSNAAKVYSFFRNEKNQNQDYTPSEKLELITELEGKSAREAQLMLVRISPQAATPDRVKNLSDTTVEISFSAPRELKDKLERLRGLRAHTASSFAELIDQLCELGLEAWNPVREPQKRVRKKKPACQSEKATTGIELDQIKRSEKATTVEPAQIHQPAKTSATYQKHGVKRVRIHARLRRAVWQRDGGVCTNCKSTHALEIDHIIPVALQGQTTLENLRLLCRACNQRAAIIHFGSHHMDLHLHLST